MNYTVVVKGAPPADLAQRIAEAHALAVKNKYKDGKPKPARNLPLRKQPLPDTDGEHRSW